MAEQEIHRLANGRRVALHRLAEGGPIVVFCHSAPGAANFDPDPQQSAAQGVTMLALDRPGYGASDPVAKDEWATPGAAADDIAEILDRLGMRSVGVAGWSAGGRVALALAARRPDLVSRAVLIATPAPDEEVAWIPPQYKAGIDALGGLPPSAVHAGLAEMLRAMQPADPYALDALGPLGTGAADAAALANPGSRRRLGDMLTQAWAQGPAGMAADIAGYTMRPWGFTPGEVAAKVMMFYGDADPVAGGAHGKWWLGKLPDGTLKLMPGMGHLLVIPVWARALAFLTGE
jgi:pimeloyl-ACP methyl ester carboxylesterase